MSCVYENSELRHLPPAIVNQLCNLLDGKLWKEVMSAVPLDPTNSDSGPKYRAEHIVLVETYAGTHNKSATEILINEWGTSGRVRPTLRTLLDVLLKLKMYRAANYIKCDLLKEGPVSEEFSDAPSVLIAVDRTSGVIPVPYSVLSECTGYWNDTPFQRDSNNHAVGHFLGSGGFGVVYHGFLPDGTEVAVKRLKDDTVALFTQFQNEITTLSTYRHKNLVPLLGYSQDGPSYCLIYEYMPNKSLQDRLATDSAALTWRERLIIALGVCEGLEYLHTRTPPLIHRDVKTANILLDENMEARLGDFGLVRTSPTDSRMTSTIFGTSAYMAPEAFRGDVSVKTDVFSVGVVLLELLTALSPYDESREGADIVTHVEETIEGNIGPLLDPRADWEIAIAEAVFGVAQICITEKKKRPVTSVVINLLSEVLEGVSQA